MALNIDRTVTDTTKHARTLSASAEKGSGSVDGPFPAVAHRLGASSQFERFRAVSRECACNAAAAALMSGGVRSRALAGCVRLSLRCTVVQWNAMRCGAVRCGAVRCGAVRTSRLRPSRSNRSQGRAAEGSRRKPVGAQVHLRRALAPIEHCGVDRRRSILHNCRSLQCWRATLSEHTATAGRRIGQ